MTVQFLSLWHGLIDKPESRALMRDVAQAVADKHGISLDVLRSEKRDRPIAWARQEAMWECRRQTTQSLPQIGLFFGGRDHSTVLHGIHRHQARISSLTA